MSNIETVYDAIKKLPQPCEQGDIIQETGLSMESIKLALQILDKENRITHHSISSTSRENYDEMIDYSNIRAI